MHSKNLSLNGCLRWATVGMRYVVDQCTMPPPLSCKWIYARHVATILIYYSPLRLRHFLDFIILEWLCLSSIRTTKSYNCGPKLVQFISSLYHFEITSHIWFTIVSQYLVNLKKFWIGRKPSKKIKKLSYCRKPNNIFGMQHIPLNDKIRKTKEHKRKYLSTYCHLNRVLSFYCKFIYIVT